MHTDSKADPTLPPFKVETQQMVVVCPSSYCTVCRSKYTLMFITLLLLLLLFFFFWLCQILVAAWEIFSCSLWDLVSWSGIKPRPSALGMWSLRDWTTREILVYYTSTQLFYLCLSVYSLLIIFQIKDLYNHLEH